MPEHWQICRQPRLLGGRVPVRARQPVRAPVRFVGNLLPK